MALRVRPAPVRQDFLASDGTTGVTCEKKYDFGEVLRLEQLWYTLGFAYYFLGARGDIFAQLSFGHHPARRNGIYANSRGSQLPCQRSAESDNRCFAGY